MHIKAVDLGVKPSFRHDEKTARRDLFDSNADPREVTIRDVHSAEPQMNDGRKSKGLFEKDRRHESPIGLFSWRT